MSGKYSQIFFDHAKQFSTDPLKTTLKREIQKTAEITGGLISNKIAERITKVWRISPKNNSKTKWNEHDKEIHKERYTSPEERQKIIDDLRLI